MAATAQTIALSADRAASGTCCLDTTPNTQLTLVTLISKSHIYNTMK